MKATIFSDRTGGVRYPIAYAVAQGRLLDTNRPLSLRDLHDAELVIIVKDGHFQVWKDRDGVPGRIEFEDIWKRILQCRERYGSVVLQDR